MTFTSRSAMILVASISLLAAPLFAGNLTPPGAPAPTMKTLQQVEPRTPITSLPFTISEPGSYYLQGNLTVAGEGIQVSADNVAIDLMGFTIVGLGAGNSRGVNIDGQVGAPRQNVSVRNGTIRGFTYGIRLFNVEGCRFEDLTLMGNTLDGVFVTNSTGSSSSILFDSCLSYANGRNGFRSQVTNAAGRLSSLELSNSAITDNAAGGISFTATAGSMLDISIVDCLVAGNGGTGIGLYSSGTGSLRAANIIDCTVSRNSTFGIQLQNTSQSLVDGNRVSETQDVDSFGIHCSGVLGNTIIRNIASNNGTDFLVNAATDTYGPIVSATGELASTGAAAHPWANLSR